MANSSSKLSLQESDSSDLSPQAFKTLHALKNNIPYFMREVLKIKTKSGEIVPFVMNESQCELHRIIEDQKRSTGKVRILVLKGRQQGVSTYVSGRYYQKNSTSHGKSVFIMAHDKDTSLKLFGMASMYYDLSPDVLKPETSASSRKELAFKKLNSSYYVGTAGSKNTGRGGTVQYFHGSEVAFWDNTDGIATGALQAVPDLPNTEVILESTANGMGNMFYERCMQAMRGEGDYILAFLPWFLQKEYSRALPEDGFNLTAEEEEYKGLYTLSDEQICWRRAKTAELGVGEAGRMKFRQEYPATALEAFQVSGESLISNELILKARKCKVLDHGAPVIIGVDPARGGDRTAIVVRRGRQVLAKIKPDTIDQMVLAGTVMGLINEYKAQKCFIDYGHGIGLYDRLVELGYGDIVEVIQFGSRPIDANKYLNKRVEMWCTMAEWFEGHDINILDDDEIHQDLSCVPTYQVGSNGRRKLVPKDEIRKKTGLSPDIGDALALTFAYPVMRVSSNKRISKVGGSLKRVLRRKGR